MNFYYTFVAKFNLGIVFRKKKIMEGNKTGHLSKFGFWGVIVTLGIVYGDIGTSPLYVMKAIIGANAVVTKNIPAGAVAVGIPARVINA